MKKKFKVIGLLLCVFFVAASVMFSGDSIKVFADDNFEVGTHNFNNTAENSAKVGDSLTTPEIGWKRYDATNSKITYTSGWENGNCQGCYDGTETYTDTPNIVKKVSFSFRGTKFRIIGNKYPEYNPAVSVTVDGIKVDTYNPSGLLTRQVLLYKYDSNKPMANHSVVLQFDTATAKAEIDAIDIDSTGDLNKEAISLDKTTDSIEEGQTDKLLATVKPDDTTNKAVTWKSSDDTIVRVLNQSTGEIKAVKEGTATITATTQDGSNLSASCAVTVTKAKTPTPATHTTDNSDKAALNITMTNGQVKQYNVTMNEVNKFMSWYKLRSAGSGDPFYKFDITQSSSPNIIRSDYVVFDKISSFEVDDYTK